MTTVDLVVPFFAKEKELVPLITSINKLSTKKINLQIIIIDDNTKEKFSNTKKLSKFRIKLLHNKKNLGPSYSRNLGIKNSKSEFIWLLDHDVVVQNKDFLKIAIKLFNKNKCNAISGAKEILKNSIVNLIPVIFPNSLGLYKVIKNKKFSIVSPYIDGCSVFLKREVFLNKGFYNNKLRAYEEYEWSIRNFKLRTLFRDDLMLSHREKKISQNFFSINYYKNIVYSRNVILKAHNPVKKKILFFLDVIFLPIMFFLLHIKKSHISTRHSMYGEYKNLSQFFKIIFLLFKSYFR